MGEIVDLSCGSCNYTHLQLPLHSGCGMYNVAEVYRCEACGEYRDWFVPIKREATTDASPSRPRCLACRSRRTHRVELGGYDPETGKQLASSPLPCPGCGRQLQKKEIGIWD